MVKIKPGPAGNEGHAEIAGPGENVGDDVLMRTIDSFNLQNVSLIKIDVENYEEEVLRAAKTTIRMNRPVILIEILGGSWFHIENVSPQLMQQIEKIKTILVKMGYSVERIYGCDFLAIPKERKK